MLAIFSGIIVPILGNYIIPSLVGAAILYLQTKHINISRTALAEVLKLSGSALTTKEAVAQNKESSK